MDRWNCVDLKYHIEHCLLEPQGTDLLLRDDLYAAIRTSILDCRLLPGAELREQALAGQYGVSKAPVRDALLRLEQERLVRVRPRQGYQVAPVSVGEARDLLRFRAVLEPACAIAAARDAEDALLEALETLARSGLTDGFVAYNRRFHAALADAGGNRRMALATHDLVAQADRLVQVSLDAIQGRDPERLVMEHVAIAAALRARDGRRAARLVRDHLAAAERRILAALQRRAIVE